MKNIIRIAIIVLLINSAFSVISIAQTHLVVSSNNLVMDGDYLVLENTKLTNNGTFQSGNGNVIITGDATDANSTIDGTTQITFYNLEINKSANNAVLANDVEVSNSLTLSNGHLDLDAYNLIITNTGTISNSSSSSFVKTSSSGTLIQEVSNSNILFPIGNQSYTPITLNNAGTTDDFNVRIENTVYQDGTSGSVITTDVVDATWHIEEAITGGSDITATFQWNDSDELTNFNRTQSFTSNYHDSMWNNGTASAAAGSNPYTLSESNISTFSPFIVASNTAILPIELLYFYGEKQGGDVLLSWETATEINNDYFDVEFSLDGITFEKIGQLRGAGTTSQNQSYTFLHDLKDVIFQNEQPLYYRLKQVDFDKKFEYTQIISVTIKTENLTTIKIYPNPARHYLNIESEDLIGEIIQILNVNGQLVKEFQHGSTISNISITNLASGTYFIKTKNEIKKVIVLK